MRACQHFLFLCGNGGCRRHRAIFDAVEFVVEVLIGKTHSPYTTHAFSFETIHLRMLSCFQSLKPYTYPGFQSLKPYTYPGFQSLKPYTYPGCQSLKPYTDPGFQSLKISAPLHCHRRHDYRRKSFARNQTVELTGCPSRVRCRWAKQLPGC